MRMAAPSRLRATFFLALSALAAIPASSPAQTKPALITQAENAQPPYFFTGRLTVHHGADEFFGTATFIRRYTGLTCGHLLYNGNTGFSTDLIFSPHYYIRATGNMTTVASFNVLSGYQGAAAASGDSDAAFARDLGYVLFVTPAPNNNWANWETNPPALTQSGPHMALGYAAESFTGNVMAFVNSSQPYAELQEGLYESTDYYTESGMSGGPLYLFDQGQWEIVAETVAGTSPPAPALSDVRAITAEARTLLIDPEYTQGLIKSAFISGPQTVSLGDSNIAYKCGAVFADGKAEWNQLTPRYDELKLVAGGPNKAQVLITKKKAGKYKVDFGGLASGQSVELRVLRDTARNQAQTPLARYTVTVD